tara:strand:+ start:42 stop:2012 length:1971 start_codon:yes stop_codon:yes gene_type:complete
MAWSLSERPEREETNEPGFKLYYGIPGQNDHTEGIEYKKPIPIDQFLQGRDSTPKEVVDLRSYFLNQKDKIRKTVRVPFEGGTLVAQRNPSIFRESDEPIINFYPDNSEYNVANMKNLNDLALINQTFTTIAGAGAALAGARPQTQHIHMKGKYEQGVKIPVTPQGMSQAASLSKALNKGARPDYNNIINQVQALSRLRTVPSDIVKGPFPSWQSQNVPFGQTSSNIDKATYDAALQTNAQGSDIARDKAGRPIAPAEQVKEDILSGIIPEPTLEQLELAIRGGGAQNKAGWIYNRSRVQGFPPSLRDRLLSEYGGTPELAEQFRKEQLAHKRYMDTKVIPQMNSEARLGYLIFFSTAREIGGRDLPEFTTDMTWENEVFNMYMRFLASPSGSAVYDLGHVQAAKNIDLYSKPGERTTADFASNLEPEMRRSMKDFIMKEAPDGNLMRAGEKRKINDWEQDLVALRVAEPGNIKRKNLQDLPRLLNLFRNVNPNVELEYIRFLSKHGYDAERGEYHEDATNYDEVLTDIIDPMEQEALLAHVRKYILKRQRNIKNKTGARQLKLYPKWLRAGINSYMNTRYKTKAQLDVEHESGQTIDAADKEAKIWAEQQAERGLKVIQEDISIKEALKDIPSDEQLSDMIDNWLEGLRPEDIEE